MHTAAVSHFLSENSIWLKTREIHIHLKFHAKNVTFKRVKVNELFKFSRQKSY